MERINLKDKVVAVVRIRGRVNVRGDITETLERLHLKRVSNCAIIRITPSYDGMLKKCNDYVAFGEVNEEILGKLLEKNELKVSPKEILSGKADMKALTEQMPIRLHPPRHGYKSTKLAFNQGGNLGYMGEEINGLLKRMV
ncbi:MAG TPA: uL30 family ribosomal protein [Candidatus Acidoferrales bacterium]|nr:uL30 family ribosomal protein [Candidatus Acidoferrales bacterium]